MPLMTLTDFQAPAKSDTAMTVADAAPFRILASEQERLMPPVDSTMPLTMSEKVLLIHWLTSGAAGVTTPCDITEPAH
jgi:hypothetical protein